MSLMKWDESFSVNVAEIDAQHRKLIDMINSFYASQMKGDNGALRSLLSGLAEYAASHFAMEERYFDRYGYADAAGHKEEHRLFTAKVQDIMERLDNGKLVISFELTNFIKDWVVAHVKGEDRKYSRCFNEAGLR
jgi:hemerythrin